VTFAVKRIFFTTTNYIALILVILQLIHFLKHGLKHGMAVISMPIKKLKT
jgi:hypothetical protein